MLFMFFSPLFLIGLTINTTLFYWRKLASASRFSLFFGAFSVFLGVISYYYLIIHPTKIIKEFNQNVDWKAAKSVYDFTIKDIKGNTVSLDKYKSHVLLIVNVASECGLTDDNYRELVELDNKYRQSKNLRILAFPCNQFGEQEPGTNEDICKFAEEREAKFDFFDKINVNGKNAHPLWKYLKFKKGNVAIEWNFAKFIVNRNGQVVKRFHPDVSPLELLEALEEFW